jgi:hypothetical protein
VATATPNHEFATVSYVNRDYAIGEIITIVVTAEDNDPTNQRTYKITIERKPSSDATLTSLTVTSNGKTYLPEVPFSPAITAYTYLLPNSARIVTIVVTSAEYSNSTGAGDKNTALGNNTFQIIVTAEDSTTKTYTLTMNVAETTSSVKEVTSLTVKSGNTTLELVPPFDKSIFTYALTVENGVTTIDISCIVSALDGRFEPLVDGDGTKTLIVGENTFTITVTAEDGSKLEYVISVSRLDVEPTTPLDIVPIILISAGGAGCLASIAMFALAARKRRGIK